jgi:hypothetical protein
MNWILDLLTQIGIRSNYSAITKLHTVEITVANTKFSPARSVFNSRFLVTDVKSGDSSASRGQTLSVRRIPRLNSLNSL